MQSASLFVYTSLALLLATNVWSTASDILRIGGQLKIGELDPECNLRGGICYDSCPIDRESLGDGLCDDDLICCNGIPDSVTDCRERGGECITREECGNNIIENLGKCSDDKVCCVGVTF